MLHGIPVTLLNKTQTGVDAAGRPAYSWSPVTVENVLVAPMSEVDSTQGLLPTGHRAVYHMAIPKTDTHTWEGQLVQFFGNTWAVVGIPTRGIDDLIPGPWNQKVAVELYRTGAPSIESLWADSVTLWTEAFQKDAAGYDIEGDPQPRNVTAIFTEGVDSTAFSQDQKAGPRRSATVELWSEDYQSEQRLMHNDVLYEVRECKNTGRGTVLLKIEEVWR